MELHSSILALVSYTSMHDAKNFADFWRFCSKIQLQLSIIT